MYENITMPNYQLGKIYKIVNDVDDKIYIGSTCYPLFKRFYKHKISAERGKQMAIIKYMKLLGDYHFRIILIENFPCNSKDELNRREQYHIDSLKPFLNFIPAFEHKKQRVQSSEHIMKRVESRKNNKTINLL